MMCEDNGERLECKVQDTKNQGGPGRESTSVSDARPRQKVDSPYVKEQNHSVIQQHLYPIINKRTENGRVHHSTHGKVDNS